MDRNSVIGQLAALSALGLNSQDQRLLSMRMPAGDAPDALLLVNRLTAREELSRDFRFEAELLSDDARIPLKAMMGKMVTIAMVREDGTLRHFNGYVSEFAFMRTDGGFAHYRMVLSPWLAFARLRKDCVAFHRRNVAGITEETFARYPERCWNSRVYGPDPLLTNAIQYNETDYNHLHRRWEALGWYYWYEHSAEGHTLWLSDRSALAEPIDAMRHADVPEEMPFRSEAGSSEDDSIHQWQAVRRMGSGMTTLASYDYKNTRPQRATGDSLNQQGKVPSHEVYEDGGAYAYQDSDGGETLATRRMAERDSMVQHFLASGNDRTAQSGRAFTLGGHFSGERKLAPKGQPQPASIAGRQYLILSVLHTASNNYQAGTKAPSHYENEFVCVRRDIDWLPGRGYNSAPCQAPAVLTATVVGPAGEEIHTDALARIRVRFHWDRLAKDDEASSAWVRVALPMAGAHIGHGGLPRVKQEVLVQFMDGNIDRPIVTGTVYNHFNMPPWELPQQRALTGWRSGEMKGKRSNHLILDDTSGKIQVQLKSDHQHSQLSLGHITRIEDSAGRKDARGEGFELRTDGHGVARAAKGMLLTTEARINAASHIKDMAETLQRLTRAAELQKSSAALATQQKAQESEAQQGAVAAALKSQNDDIKGAGGDAHAELSAPHLVLASPAGIESSAAQSTHIASAEHTALTTGKSLSLAAGDSLFASIRETFRLFVHKAGMKLIAAAGKVSIQANTDEVEIIAQKVLNLISQADWVDIRGRKGVRLHGANSMLEISEKVQFFTSSPTLFHGNLETLGPKNRPQPAAKAAPAEEAAPDQPSGKLLHALQGHLDEGRHYANTPYTVLNDGSTVAEGITDELGRVPIAHLDGTKQYQVVLANGEEFTLQVSPCFTPAATPDGDEQTLSNEGLRALAATTESRWQG